MVNLTKITIIKIVELAIVCCIIGIHWHSFELSDRPTYYFSITAAGGYLIILVGLLAAALTGTPVNRRVDLYFSIMGFIVFLVAGSLVIDAFRSYHVYSYSDDNGLARGSLCIIEAAIFVIDAVLVYKGES